MIVERAGDVWDGDGGAGWGGVDIEAGIELAEVFLGGVETLGEDFDERGVGHFGLFRLLCGFGGVGAGAG